MTESSGSQILDEAACTLVTARAQFQPALDEQGRAIEGRYDNVVHWQVPETTVPLVPFSMRIMFDVDRAGHVKNCQDPVDASMPKAVLRAFDFKRFCEIIRDTGVRYVPPPAPSGDKVLRHVVIDNVMTISAAPPPN